MNIIEFYYLSIKKKLKINVPTYTLLVHINYTKLHNINKIDKPFN